MSNLESWLDDKTSEVRRREEAGFPEDVDAEIKWNKVGKHRSNPSSFESCMLLKTIKSCGFKNWSKVVNTALF